MTSEKLIERLCAEFGPTGCESAVAELIKKEIADVCPDAKYDRMGNLIAPMRFGDLAAADRKRIMVSAHTDEVGFMITEIKKGGYLGFGTVGGISESVLAGRRVRVLGKGNTFLNGVIASKAIHHKTKEEEKKPTPIKDLYIDIGATDVQSASELVRVGDFAAFDSEFYGFGDGYVKGKALDDRMGCAAMLEIMDKLRAEPPAIDADIYFCFTVREEIGFSGAECVANIIRPDFAVILETTAIGDLPETEACRRVADVGKGGVISVADRSTIYQREVVDFALDLAKEKNIPAQIKRYVSGGNDAGHIHKSTEGVKVLAISVPTRYLHSPACVASLDDYESVRDLCEQIVRNSDKI